jgi:hypothetical protein
MERQALNLPVPPVIPTGVDQTRRLCPVCKSSCSVTSVIPIYVRNEPTKSSKPAAHSDARRHEEDDFISPLDVTSPETVESSETAALNAPSDDPEISDFGLRQRLRFRSSDSQIPNASDTTATASESPVDNIAYSEALEVPARPVPRRRRSLSENAVGTMSIQLPENNRTFAISQGLALSLHRALGPTNANTSVSTAVPPLHRQEGHGSAARVGAAGQALNESDPDATEFLSRLLLMLGSFVILCLLLF